MMQVIEAQPLAQFLINVGTGGGGKDGPGAAAGDDFGQQPLIEQRLEHTGVEEAKYSAATQHQRGPPVAVAGSQEEILLFSQRDDLVIHLVQVVKRAAQFVDVAGNEILGPKPGLVIQRRLAHAAEVAMNALVKHKQQLVVILAKTQIAKNIQALTNRTVVIALARVILLPVVQPLLVIPGSSQLTPLLIAFCLFHRLQQRLAPATLKEIDHHIPLPWRPQAPHQ